MLLQKHDWPGNVRQLENLIKQVVVREDEGIIYDTLKAPAVQTGSYSTTATIPAQAKDYSLKKRVGDTVAQQEKALISEVLTKTNWNRRKAAKLLEISYRSLLYKIKDYQLTG